MDSTTQEYKAEILGCTRLMNRIKQSNPRAAAKILARRYGNHSGAIRAARAAVNCVLADAGLEPVYKNWEGVVKAPSWFKGDIKPSAHNDDYIGGGIHF